MTAICPDKNDNDPVKIARDIKRVKIARDIKRGWRDEYRDTAEPERTKFPDSDAVLQAYATNTAQQLAERLMASLVETRERLRHYRALVENGAVPERLDAWARLINHIERVNILHDALTMSVHDGDTRFD